MRYYILFFLLIVIALAACKKDSANNTNQAAVTHDSIPQHNLPSILAGVYNGSEICYEEGTNHTTYPIDTINNLSWTVTIVSDSSIIVNGSIAYIDTMMPPKIRTGS